jgi:NitT/TauT family transport system ATP-binding protein
MQKAEDSIPGAAPTKAPLIEFRNVGKTFWTDEEEVEAVRRIELTAFSGEFISLIGPSGCGKSTLLNMTAGLFHPTVGEVLYASHRVDGFNLKTGYMTQNDHLLPWRNVVGNLSVPLEIQGLHRSQIRERVDDLVALVGLKGFEKSYPSQLSGGMRKRAALARLLAYDPDTLLLDEPFAALDAQLRLKMQVELLSICRRLNKTIIFVTHDLDEAAALSDRIAIFSSRPGTIIKIITSPLAADRDLLRLRHDPDYVQLTAELWDMLTPALAQTRGEAA